MSATPQNSRAVILVKALPQPSKRHGETVCCAGVTAEGHWKRLFPVRFRHLQGSSSFSRWDWVSFRYSRPVSDRRSESCHVHEESIVVEDSLPKKARARLLQPIIVGSAIQAAALGHSLALIRPRNSQFIAKHKSKLAIENEREAFRRAARQTSMFDEDWRNSNQPRMSLGLSSKTKTADTTIRTVIGKRMQCFGISVIEQAKAMPSSG